MTQRIVWYRCSLLCTLRLEHVPQRVSWTRRWVCNLTVVATQS